MEGVRLYGDYYKAFGFRASSKRNRHGARVGIRNEGNTCYLSSVVQALTYSPLANWVLEIDPIGNVPTKAGFNLMAELATHVRKVWKLNDALAATDAASLARAGVVGHRSERAATTDISIAGTLLRCSRHAGHMEDAHECLTYVLARLLEACSVGYDGEQNDAWERSTIVYNVFGLDLMQAVVCGKCEHASRTPLSEMALRLNATLGLSEVEMAQATNVDCNLERRILSERRRRAVLDDALGYDSEDDRADEEDEAKTIDDVTVRLARRRQATPPTSVEALLRHFFASERIDDYECDKCKQRGECQKRGGFARLPNSLALYVDRVPAFGALFGKLNRVVAFEQTLDLAPFLAESHDRDQGTRFYLYALVTHIDFSGSTFFGHYVCYVRDSNGQWWLLDDETVLPMRWSQVKHINPYLLFYSKLPPDEIEAEDDSECTAETPKKPNVSKDDYGVGDDEEEWDDAQSERVRHTDFYEAD